jgi:O-antigen ligase
LIIGICAAALMLVAVAVSPIRTSVNPDFNVSFLHGRVQPSSRFLCWMSAWQKFRAHPWLGQGLGTDSADVTYLDAAGVVELLGDAHNLYLGLLAKTGIIGLLSYLWVVLAAMFAPGSRKLPSPIRTAILISLVQAIFYQGTAGSFEYSRHLWVLLGIAAMPVPDDQSVAGCERHQSE